MKFCQFVLPGKGKRTGVVLDGEVADITSLGAGISSVLDLIQRGGSSAGMERIARRLLTGKHRRVAWSDLDRPPSPRRAHLVAPLDPPEVWGAGITYRRSKEYYTEHLDRPDQSKSIYDRVYTSERPELFFKATASRTVGPNAAIGVRGDSALTAVEAELAVVVGPGGKIVGYTAGNDCSAWDIERENPLYLAQSKIFGRCFAMGPVLVTAAELADPHVLEISCTISRSGKPIYQARANTREMKRPSHELVDWLCRYNPIPAGTVLSTGTGILVPDNHALAQRDMIEIQLEGVGTLRNPVRALR